MKEVAAYLLTEKRIRLTGDYLIDCLFGFISDKAESAMRVGFAIHHECTIGQDAKVLKEVLEHGLGDAIGNITDEQLVGPRFVATGMARFGSI